MNSTQFFSEGDKSKGMCERCKALLATTFVYCDVPFSDASGNIKDILAGVCDHCHALVSIPAQSTPAISRARNKSTESVEAFLQAPYFELLELACFKLNPDFSLDLRKALLMFYVHRFASGKCEVSRLKKTNDDLAASPKMESKVRRRLSMKISRRSMAELDCVAGQTNMQKTQILKAIIGVMQEDILNEGMPDLVKDLKEFAYFAAL